MKLGILVVGFLAVTWILVSVSIPDNEKLFSIAYPTLGALSIIAVPWMFLDILGADTDIKPFG